jgi:hypothetical protein
MAKRYILACACAFLCIAMLTFGCKKGCGTCKSYGYNSTLQNYTQQVCTNNSFCTCPNGLEGDSCQTYSILKYFTPSASWQVTDGCSGNPSYYVSLTYNQGANPNNTVFYINGLFNLGGLVEADIISTQGNQSTYLNIPYQTVGGVTFSGQGQYSNNGGFGRVTLNLDYIQGGIESNCVVQMYQQ